MKQQSYRDTAALHNVTFLGSSVTEGVTFDRDTTVTLALARARKTNVTVSRLSRRA